MARHPGAEAVYECADQFRQRCLIEGRSLLWPDRPIWTAENLELFEHAYLGNPLEDKRSFVEKLHEQLANESDDVVCLAAETIAFYCLIANPIVMGGAKKLELVNEVVAWRGTIPSMDQAGLSILIAAFKSGIADTGTYYLTARHWQMAFYIKFFRGIRDGNADPSNFLDCRALATSVRAEIKQQVQASDITLHLLFPDQVESIVSNSHKQAILKRFSVEADGHTDPIDALAAIRAHLSNKGEDPTFSFYRDDIQPLWDPKAQSKVKTDPPATTRVVKIAPGANGQYWSDCLAGEYICVGWDKVGDLQQYPDKGAFVEAFHKGFSVDYNGNKSTLTAKANELWTLMELRHGDRIVANHGTSEIFAIGTVTEPGYQWMPERKEYRHTVSVDWDTSFAKSIPTQGNWATRTVVEIPPTLWDILTTSAGGTTPGPEPRPSPDYSEPSFPAILESVREAGMRIEERTLRRYHLSLKTRGFVVLSGLSGTGKTWLAERYAIAIDARHLIVSVAPNWTTNEDLLGYASPITGLYHDTAFSRFLRAAAKEYETATGNGVQPRPYHVVLDEMNLARVEYYFAKFLSAMEVRMRYGRAEIELGPDDIVSLTPNLFVIGTVNIDETTHGFADKVYDRAQLIELEAQRDDIVAHLGDAVYAEELLLVWDCVSASGPFTFRVLDEIAAYVKHAEALDVPWQESLDEQLLQKVLPKLKGADLSVGTSLSELITWSQDRFPLTHARATLMLKRLHEHGFTSYH